MLLNYLTPILGFVIAVVKAIKDKPKFSDVILPFFSKLMDLTMGLIEYRKLPNKEKLDQALDEIDLRFGNEPGALDVMRDLPADKEEELTDHMKEIIRIVGYCKLRVPGYFVEE